MSSPNTATLTGTVTWSDGSLFDGWLFLGLVLPQNADGQWPTTVIGGQVGLQRLPIWTAVPISAGVFNNQTKVFYNTSVQPPNSQYVAYWYDLNRRRIYPAVGGTPVPFTISSSPYAISLPTLTIPATSSNYPTPTETTVGV